MSDGRDDPTVFWVEPDRRAVLPMDGFRLSQSLRKTLRSERFAVTVDRDFDGIIRLCAQSAADRPETWINHPIERSFIALHEMGLAHSVECWGANDQGEPVLLGGLYGLALGRAFFGESMVSRARDASKVALAALVARLRVGGFTLLDCQFMTPHLASLGAIEMSARDYSSVLGGALGGLSFADPLGSSADFFALEALVAEVAPERPPAPLPSTRTVSAPVSGQLIAQLLTQTS
jgi:leucyl/phenylalanyl-tRNA--protein transferase